MQRHFHERHVPERAMPTCSAEGEKTSPQDRRSDSASPLPRSKILCSFRLRRSLSHCGTRQPNSMAGLKSKVDKLVDDRMMLVIQSFHGADSLRARSAHSRSWRPGGRGCQNLPWALCARKKPASQALCEALRVLACVTQASSNCPKCIHFACQACT